MDRRKKIRQAQREFTEMFELLAKQFVDDDNGEVKFLAGHSGQLDADFLQQYDLEVQKQIYNKQKQSVDWDAQLKRLVEDARG